MTEPRDPRLGDLATERVRGDLEDLDRLGPAELVALMSSEARWAPEAVAAAHASIARAVEGVAERMDRGGRLIYVGAGTAGRLGVLDAAEAGPTFDVEDGRVTALLAGGRDAFARPTEAVEDRPDGAIADLERLGVGPDDTVVGITASGRTPYVIGALDWARTRGAFTVSVACNADAIVSAHADVPIELEVGDEIIAGSTRLNAGTAQKITLNILSTSVMVLLGRTYGNRMVHLRATNTKLRDRALRMVTDVTGADTESARAALEASGWETTVAIVMLIARVDGPTAQGSLANSRGRLRDAIDAIRAEASEGRSGSQGPTNVVADATPTSARTRR
jgi:N-acetylmuramic acid 6-phosphate etherase